MNDIRNKMSSSNWDIIIPDYVTYKDDKKHEYKIHRGIPKKLTKMIYNEDGTVIKLEGAELYENYDFETERERLIEQWKLPNTVTKREL